jgi:hypothetical protein
MTLIHTVITTITTEHYMTFLPAPEVPRDSHIFIVFGYEIEYENSGLPAVSIVFLQLLCDCCQTCLKFARDRDMIKKDSSEKRICSTLIKLYE